MPDSTSVLLRLRGMLGGRRSALLGVGGLSVLGLMLSMLTQITISSYLGTSVELDAYWIAFSWIGLASFFVTPMREALTPLVFAHLEPDPSLAMEYLGKGLGLMLICLIVAFAAILGVAVYLYGGDPVTSAYARVALPLACLAPAVLVYSLAETLNTLLPCYNRPVLQQGMRLWGNATVLLTIVLCVKTLGVLAIALGFVLGQSLMLLMQWRTLAALGMRVHFRWPSALDRGFVVTSGALIVSYLVSQSYGVVEKLAFAHMQDGLVSAYQYATTLLNGLVTLFGAVTATALFPSLLRSGAKGNVDEMADLLGRASHWLIFLTVGVCSATWILSPQIVEIIFMRGHFRADSAALTVTALQMVIFATVPMVLMALLWRALLSLPQSKGIGMAASGLAVSLTGVVVVSVALQLHSRTVLLAAAVISNSIGVGVSLFWVLKNTGPAGRRLLHNLLRAAVVGICALPSGWGGQWVADQFDGAELKILTGGTAFATGYLVLCFLTKALPKGLLGPFRA